MAKGFISGVLWAGILSGVGLGAASYLTDIPGAQAPQAESLEVPAGSGFDSQREDTEAQLPETDEAPEATETPEVTAAEPDNATLNSDITSSAGKPETGEAKDTLSDPEEGEDLALNVPKDQPVLPSPQALAPQEPVEEEDLSISTEPAQPLQPEEEEEAAFTPEDDPRPPLEKFATPFENALNKPLMAIVLIDDGTVEIPLSKLTEFPYPISIAVDASKPGVQAVMEDYRSAGIEVLAMINLPEGADARAVEENMGALMARVPQAVAVLEGQGTGLQSTREVHEQLAAILNDSGHGLVLYSQGLDTAQKLIAREGVAAQSIFRDFDGAGQNPAAMRRFLGQAAFRAGQLENGVIMLGRMREDTINTLLVWGLQDRASSVALAPISAVLRVSQQ